MKVEEVMTRDPIFIRDTDFMTHARQVIRDRHKRTLPVVDNNNRVVGILTERGILGIYSTKSNVTVEGLASGFPEVYPDMDMIHAARLMINEGLGRVPVIRSIQDKTLVGILSTADIFRNLDLEKIPKRKVGEIMTRDVKTCSAKDSIARVWLRMRESGLSGFPVLKDDHLVGMITRRNIIKAGYARIEREDEHGTQSTMSPPVEKVMSSPAYTISPHATLKEATQSLMRLDIGRLSVVDNGKLAGIVDRNDIIKAFI
ncbi:putative signal-transduction protein [Candidatus Methanoperedens nitroreducens]|uniref:Putative signal-transduction protein n=1 Tax=Candidatus Methanoperedens nitratireducens TaxID=1392998 RepID=A0A062V5Q8_9EURY|nr:CBS domain-containing protein [Candidatus Methanoperedens nitroreducens]KCZ70745.1 putative signal-transduction protein [Candidatus Methanoperedens nitroreducens]MDJ1420602.1 CBS domain-containing protein [Candidatus Methanoperedens sp.]